VKASKHELHNPTSEIEEMMNKQPNLFETPKEKRYPIIMEGMWLGKFQAIALVDTPDHKDELLEQGYVIKESEE
jgi:hypothetical protein